MRTTPDRADVQRGLDAVRRGGPAIDPSAATDEHRAGAGDTHAGGPTGPIPRANTVPYAGPVSESVAVAESVTLTRASSRATLCA